MHFVIVDSILSFRGQFYSASFPKRPAAVGENLGEPVFTTSFEVNFTLREAFDKDKGIITWHQVWNV